MSTVTDTRPARLLDLAEQHDGAPDGALTLAHRSSAPVTFAKGDPDLVVGVEVLKAGVFNGDTQITDADLMAYAARFHDLAGTFTPPHRLDHSWDVLSVVGWYEDLRVEDRPDATTGETVAKLVGDFRIVGTPDERERLRQWIKGGKLRNISSELMPYRTNTGREYARVFAGAAFVDIPAVEGLAPITLRRDAVALGSRNDEEGATVPTDDKPAEGTETPETVTPAETPEAAPETQEVPVETETREPADDDETDPAEDPTTADGITLGDPEEEPAPAGDTPEDPAPDDLRAVSDPDLVATLRAAGVTLTADQEATLGRTLEAELSRRQTAAERFRTYQARGVVPLAVADRVQTLLNHRDPAVSDGVAAILDLASPPVTLGAHLGDLASERAEDDTRTTPAELREMDRAEFGNAWANLTPEQRRTTEYVEAYRAVMDVAPTITV